MMPEPAIDDTLHSLYFRDVCTNALAGRDEYGEEMLIDELTTISNPFATGCVPILKAKQEKQRRI